MQLNNLLNRIYPVKGFVYENVQIAEDHQQSNAERLTAHTRPRQGSYGISDSCNHPSATCDRLDEPRLAFVPTWGIAVMLLYAKRQLNYRRFGEIHANESIGYVCSDMRRHIVKVIHNKLPQALQTLDCYYLVPNLNKALDEMRVKETW